MRKRLGKNFYQRDTLRVAQGLLGKYIVRKWRGREIKGKIVETEAYIGPQDKASHAFGGKVTSRNKAVYLPGGYIYIYLVYGIYWQLNISTSFSGKPECVLIRALEPVGRKERIASGPGKLCRYLKLNKSFYGEDLTKSKRIWLEDWGEKIKRNNIIQKERIGINYAQEWAKKPWRFYIQNNMFISHR